MTRTEALARLAAGLNMSVVQADAVFGKRLDAYMRANG